MHKKYEDRWPTVEKNDDGIRACDLNRCHYCRKEVGKRHGPECVVVRQLVELEVLVDDKVVGRYIDYVPYHWDSETIDFHFNESSWCCDNAVAGIEWLHTKKAQKVIGYIDNLAEDECTCNYLYFRFKRVVDFGPFVAIREEQQEIGGEG